MPKTSRFLYIAMKEVRSIRKGISYLLAVVLKESVRVDEGLASVSALSWLIT